ncbi:MAG TPA: TonB family protein [Candidatus Acidoferrum sp.]|nr:TonB family protein [Candidatus Acidoferrum sp.]
MAPIAKEPEAQNSAAPVSPAVASQPKVQPVALEIAVTVNGARTVEGSDKREPFSETTQTVLVFGNGAVIRLNSSVAPGQLLFLTNEKTKKEVVCQVVKSKNYRSVSGYVELEFTESAIGFWGMRFPTDRVGTAPANATPVPPAPVKPAAPAASLPAVSAPVIAPAPKQVVPPAPITVALPVAPPPAPVNAAPAVAEKSAPQVAAPAAPADNASDDLRKETARLQAQLSSMLFEETSAAKPAAEIPKTETAPIASVSAKVLEIVKAEPVVKAAAPAEVAPAPPKQKPATSLHDEQVKIPSWLEPLARNAATPVPPSSTPAPVVTPQAPPALVSLTDAPSAPVSDDDAQVVGESYEFSNKPDLAGQQQPDADQNVPNFGSDLFQSGDIAEHTESSRGKKGLWIGAIAATLLLAAGGGWWYTQNSGAASASTVAASRPAENFAPTNAEPQQRYLASTSTPPTAKAFSTPTPVTTQPAVTEKPLVTPATEVQKIPSSRDVAKPNVAPASTAGRAADPVEETRKATFSQLHLAAPKVSGGKAAEAPGVGDPGIAMENGSANSPGALNSALGGARNNTPTAPIPVGGEVKSVQLISSVPPVYPQLARTQRISGDVKIDALIDESGRVTGMKVVSGPVLLHQAAMDSLRQWKYRPASLDGKPVAMHLLVTVQFRLQ